MKATSKRSVCPVACTLDLIGDKWTLLVVRDLLAGKSHYQELASSPEGIASNILADRLERLQSCGLVRAEPSAKRAGSAAYALTAQGNGLLPVLRAMKQWGLENVAGTEARVEIKRIAGTRAPGAASRGRRSRA